MALIRLLILGGLGFLLHRLLTGNRRPAPSRPAGPQRAPHRAPRPQPIAASILQNPASGLDVSTVDLSGTSVRHRVGRGIVRR